MVGVGKVVPSPSPARLADTFIAPLLSACYTFQRLRIMKSLYTASVLGFLATVSCLGGCTYSVSVDVPLHHPPLIEPLPLRVGVYYSPEFRTYEHRQIIRGEIWKNTWKFSLGPPSVALFDLVFPTMFETVPVQSRPPLASSAPELAAVIEPRIERFHLAAPELPVGMKPISLFTFSATIEYRFTLYSTRGDLIASWLESGRGEIQHTFVSEAFPFTGIVKGIYNEVTVNAMREAAANLSTRYREEPGVQGWLLSIGLAAESPRGQKQ